MMKNGVKQKLLSLSVAFALAASGCIAAGAADGLDEEPAPVGTAVETSFLRRTTIRSELTYIGQIQPLRTVNVASLVTAEVTGVNFDVGDVVEEGDILFTVDTTDIQNQLRQSQAGIQAQNVQLEQFQYQLELAQSQQRLVDLNQEAAVQRAETAAAAAELDVYIANTQQRLWREFNRDALRDLAEDRREIDREIRELERDFRRQGYTRDNWIENPRNPDAYMPHLGDQYERLREMLDPLDAERFRLENERLAREAAARGAELGQSSAADALALAELGLEVFQENNEQAQRLAEFGVQSAQAQINAARAGLSTVYTQLGRTTVTSPISGIVSARNVEVGQLAAGGVPFTIVQIDPVIVQVSVSESLINAIYLGQEVDVVIQALGGQETLTGLVSIISPVAAATSTFPVHIELDNADGRIRPGMFSQVTFVEAQSQNTFVVPKNVVQTDEQGAFVFVVQNDFAVRTPVRTGMETGNEIEILSGVTENDQIVMVGQEFLQDGMLLNIVAVDGRRSNG